MNGLTDLAMPFMIQTLRDYAGKVESLMAARKEAQVAPTPMQGASMSGI